MPPADQSRGKMALRGGRQHIVQCGPIAHPLCIRGGLAGGHRAGGLHLPVPPLSTGDGEKNC